MSIEKTFFRGSVLSVVGTAIGLVACSSSSSPSASETYTSTAAAVAGAADSHCGAKTVTISQAACKAAPAADNADAAPDNGDTDGGTDDCNQSDYGATLNNSEGDDDDCKYHVKWTTNTSGENVDVKYQVVVTTKIDGKPLAGAPISAEVFLDCNHPAPNSGQKTVETSPGTYVVGPIRFDAPGKWTVRFHIHEDCNDSEDSPHGHAAFFAQVP